MVRRRVHSSGLQSSVNRLGDVKISSATFANNYATSSSDGGSAYGGAVFIQRFAPTNPFRRLANTDREQE